MMSCRISSPSRCGRSVAAALLGGLLAVTAPSAGHSDSADRPSPAPEESLEEATQHLLRAIELMLMAIPRYAAPEVLENGDIIIRRIPPQREDAPPVAPERDAPERTDI